MFIFIYTLSLLMHTLIHEDSKMSQSFSLFIPVSLAKPGICMFVRRSGTLPKLLGKHELGGFFIIHIHIYIWYSPPFQNLPPNLFVYMYATTCQCRAHTHTHTHPRARTHTHTGRFCIYSSSAGSGHNQNEGSAHVLANRQESR